MDGRGGRARDACLLGGRGCVWEMLVRFLSQPWLEMGKYISSSMQHHLLRRAHGYVALIRAPPCRRAWASGGFGAADVADAAGWRHCHHLSTRWWLARTWMIDIIGMDGYRHSMISMFDSCLVVMSTYNENHHGRYMVCRYGTSYQYPPPRFHRS